MARIDPTELDPTFPDTIKDLTGKIFTRLTVTAYAGRKAKKVWGHVYYWFCRCECGKVRMIAQPKLVQGRTVSCGCVRRGVPIKKHLSLSGLRIGRFRVLKLSDRSLNRKSREKVYWDCACDCGTLKEIREDVICRNDVISCGCHTREAVGDSVRTHGRSSSSEYRIWSGLKSRCLNPNTPHFEHYGGRGIKVCQRYRDSFEAFYADVGGRPSFDYSIDREDTDGHYSCGQCDECKKNNWPSNLRWATDITQMRNTRHNRNVTWRGKTQTLAAWAEELRFKPGTLLVRLDKMKLSIEEAFTMPLKRTRKNDPYHDINIYHMADRVNPKGDVSALCYKTPRKVSSLCRWTLDDAAVTCKRCLQLLAASSVPQNTEPHHSTS